MPHRDDEAISDRAMFVQVINNMFRVTAEIASLRSQ
mgnify:FL=1